MIPRRGVLPCPQRPWRVSRLPSVAVGWSSPALGQVSTSCFVRSGLILKAGDWLLVAETSGGVVRLPLQNSTSTGPAASASRVPRTSAPRSSGTRPPGEAATDSPRSRPGRWRITGSCTGSMRGSRCRPGAPFDRTADQDWGFTSSAHATPAVPTGFAADRVSRSRELAGRQWLRRGSIDPPPGPARTARGEAASHERGVSPPPRPCRLAARLDR